MATIQVPRGELRVFSIRGMRLSGITPTIVRTEPVAEPPAGSLSLTGIQPSGDSIIPVPLGAIAFSGKTPSVPKNISVPIGSLSVSGLEPERAKGLVLVGYGPTLGIQGGEGIAVPKGTTALNEKTPLLDTSYGAGAGSLSLSGKQPLAFTSLEIDVPAGSLSLTAYQAGPGNAPQVPVGTLSLTTYEPERAKGLLLKGFAPSLAENQQLVQPGSDSLSIEGKTPALETIIGYDGSSLNLDGYAPLVSTGAISDLTARPGSGSASFTGYASTLQVTTFGTQTRFPPDGSLSLAGYAPSVSESVVSPTLNPGAGNVGIVSGPPSVSVTGNTNPSIGVQDGSVSLSGKTPGLDIGYGVPVGSISLTGRQIPGIPDRLRPETGDSSLIGLQPRLAYSWTTKPQKGSVSFTGYSPAVPFLAVNVPDLTEYAIRRGGEQIILSLKGTEWVSGQAFQDARQSIIDGITSNKSEEFGWNNRIRDQIRVNQVRRATDTTVIITLPFAPEYSITEDETITVTVPAAAITTGFDITA